MLQQHWKYSPKEQQIFRSYLRISRSNINGHNGIQLNNRRNEKGENRV